MDTGKRDLKFTRGDDYSHRFTFVETDQTTPIDLTDCTFAAQLRTYPDEAIDTAFTVDDSDVADGIVTISLAAAATATLGRGYVWDLEMTDQNGDVVTVLAGAVSVVADVTRS